MKPVSKAGIGIALFVGLSAAAYLIWSIGIHPVFAAIARAGISGLALLCIYALLMFVSLALAWFVLLPPDERRPLSELFLARLVRDSIAEISPFSPVGGMVAAARLMILKGMSKAYAAASVAADATTEAMAQVVFLAFGFGFSYSEFRHFQSANLFSNLLLVALVMAVPGIAVLIFLQKRGATFAERVAARFFPQMREGLGFHAAMLNLYDSRSRLAASAFWHLIGWIAAGGGTYLGFHLVGGHIDLLNAIALEALLCTIRSLAAFVPAAAGVQEAGYAMLAPIFGLPADMGLAVSLLKRAREIILGVPALLYWQAVEGRSALLGNGLSDDCSPK